MSAGFAAGVGFALRGCRLLAQPGLRRFVIGPVAINIAVFAYAFASFSQLFQHLMDRYCAGWPEWALWIAWLVFGTLAAVSLFFTFSMVANGVRTVCFLHDLIPQRHPEWFIPQLVSVSTEHLHAHLDAGSWFFCNSASTLEYLR